MKHRVLILALIVVVFLSQFGASVPRAHALIVTLGQASIEVSCSGPRITITGSTPLYPYHALVWMGTNTSVPPIGFGSGSANANGTSFFQIPMTRQPVGTILTIKVIAVMTQIASVTAACSDSSEQAFWNPGDDRVNDKEPGEPAAIYCREGGVQVWAVDATNSRGTLALMVTKAEIAKVKDSKPAENTLIKASADGKIKLYYLAASGELSLITTYLNSDKPYTFVWKGCK